MFKKLEFDTIYYAYLIESPFKYYISILGGMGGRRPCLFCLFRGSGGPEFGKPCLYNTCTLPNTILGHQKSCKIFSKQNFSSNILFEYRAKNKSSYLKGKVNQRICDQFRINLKRNFKWHHCWLSVWNASLHFENSIQRLQYVQFFSISELKTVRFITTKPSSIKFYWDWIVVVFILAIPSNKPCLHLK